MAEDIDQEVHDVNHARLTVTRAEKLIDVADKYHSDVQGAMKILATGLPDAIKKPLFKKLRLKNAAGKWIIVNHEEHWNFINLDTAAKIIRETLAFLNQKSLALSKKM